MITARILLDTRREARKGHPVKIYVSGYGKKAYISTGYFSHLDHWKDGPTRVHPDRSIPGWFARRAYDLTREVAHCNEHRMDFEASLEVIRGGLGSEDELQALRRRIAELEGRGAGVTLLSFWETFTGELAAAGKSTRALDDTRKQVEQYASDIALRSMGYEWLRAFRLRKEASGTGAAGISFYLRTIRRVYLEAQRRPSLGVPTGNPFMGLIPPTRAKERARLQHGDLEKIAAYVPRDGTTRANAKRMRQRLGVLLFQIYIGGHDLVDVARLTWEDVTGRRVRLSRWKNRSRAGALVDNLILPQAEAIISEIGTPDRRRVFGFIPDPETEPVGYRMWRDNTNRALRVLSEDLGLRVGLSTKSPRYIFRTWAGEAGADILATMQIQGHRGRGVTFSYQGRLPDRIIDEVLVKIIWKP